MPDRPRVIIVGAGFGGLYAAKALGNQPVDVLLVDRNNYHTFLPLLYQVATAGLEPEEVAAPVRGIVRRARNITFLLAELIQVDPMQKVVHLNTGSGELVRPYDYLVLSPGSVTSFFGLTNVEERSFELKTLSDAIRLRNHVLNNFERALTTSDPATCDALMTVVIVGGGPTGIELAGAMSELFRYVLRKDYTSLDFGRARVVLVEAMDHLLAAFPESLQKSAQRQLERLGVEVMLGKSVSEASNDAVTFKDGTTIPTCTIIWAAGVQAAELDGLEVERQRGRRIKVEPTLHMAEHPQIFIIGDASFLLDAAGHPFPQLAPVAMQMGRTAAHNILAAVQGKPLANFHYSDRGIMATIGRSKAVAWVFNKIQLRGYLAWVAWLVLHLLYLIGFRNRANVLINWAWNWWTWERGVRIILNR